MYHKHIGEHLKIKQNKINYKTMENSIFFQILTMIICFGLGGGLIFSSILNWKYWHKPLTIGLIIAGLGLFYYGIVILIKFII